MSKREKQMWKKNLITLGIMFYGFPLLIPVAMMLGF